MTGIRGIAAVWVLSFHLSIEFAGLLLRQPDLDHTPVLRNGWAGVDLFFILSGFILTYAHRDDFRTLRLDSLLRFAKLRIIRVYPLNTVVLLLILACACVDSEYWAVLSHRSIAGHPPEAFVRTLLLGTQWLPGAGSWNEPTWSLSAELLGYTMFPLAAFLMLRVDSFWLSIQLAATTLICLLVYLVTHTTALNAMEGIDGLVRMFFCFSTGVALAQARRTAPAWVADWSPLLSIVAAIGVVGLAALGRTAIFLPIPLALLIFALSFSRGPIDRFCRSPLMMGLGRISFSFYLIHTQCIFLFWVNFLPLSTGRVTGAAILVLYLGTVAGLSWLLYRYVEKPSHRLARRWAGEPSQRSAPSTSSGTQSGVSSETSSGTPALP